MPDTSHLFRTSDDAREDLAVLDRHVAEAKDACRAAIEKLVADLRATHGHGNRLRIQDADGRCFSAILEAIDDMVAAKRDAIRARVEEADISIEDAERAA